MRHTQATVRRILAREISVDGRAVMEECRLKVLTVYADSTYDINPYGGTETAGTEWSDTPVQVVTADTNHVAEIRHTARLNSLPNK